MPIFGRSAGHKGNTLSNRIYRLLYGIALLLSLYFDQDRVIYVLITIALFEALTNLRIPSLVSKFRKYTNDPNEGALGIKFKVRSNFEAERAWRISVAVMLLLSLLIYPDLLWFFPWFMGFAIMGAGVSGVCPVFLALRWAGLR